MQEKKFNFKTKDFRKKFLLEFTKALVNNVSVAPVFKLEKILEEEEAREERSPIKEKIQDIIRAKEEEISILSKKQQDLEKDKKPRLQKKRFSFNPENARLTIPESHLPPRFNYLRPTPQPMTKNVEFGKISPLIEDNNVKVIECNGANENVVVKGKMGEKQTRIVLKEKEIKEILNTFSKETKIPLQEGIYKVVLGNLVLLAIISEVVGSKFIIRKMSSPVPRGPPGKR